MDINTEMFAEALLRWGHILSGIVWMGLLYFFNFVNGPFTKSLDDATRKKVVPELMPRALFWFRWAAMATLFFGLILFWFLYLRLPEGATANSNFKAAAGGLADRARWIMYGMTFAVVMWFNVWVIIWPAQKRIIGGIISGSAAPAPLARRAYLASRTNTYLSGPMLLMMVMTSHYSTFSYGLLGLVIVLGLVVIHGLIVISPRVGRTI